jgi:hypothetical protein
VSNRTRCRAAAIRGEFAIIVVIDRHLGLPAPFLTGNAEPQQLQIALAAAGQSGEQVEVAINVTLRRPELILPAVDGEQHSVPTADKLLRSMQVAGVGPSSTAGRRAVDTAGDAQCRIANEVVSGNEAPSPHVRRRGNVPITLFAYPDWMPADLEPDRAIATQGIARSSFD